MNRNAIRLMLAAVIVFYAVVGGLWATSYIPLRKLYEAGSIQDNLMMKSPGVDYYKLPEYREASEYQELYALTHPDIFVTEARINLYQSILLWGTVALCVGGAVLFLTRRKPSR